MYLPCDSCKYKKETRNGFRVFVGCSDDNKIKGFVSDNYFYNHKCSNYEKEEIKDAK